MNDNLVRIYIWRWRARCAVKLRILVTAVRAVLVPREKEMWCVFPPPKIRYCSKLMWYCSWMRSLKVKILVTFLVHSSQELVDQNFRNDILYWSQEKGSLLQADRHLGCDCALVFPWTSGYVFLMCFVFLFKDAVTVSRIAVTSGSFVQPILCGSGLGGGLRWGFIC